jgi:DNA repair exonuclease SbcCD ATPase subunit
MEDPSNASGGERALINLALRTGLYRLIAELQGGNTAELPPLILDEPTTFLDDEHVSQLEGMLDTIRSWNVPQVFVVSHDPSLVDGADHTCEVTIDEISNTSSVTLSNTRTAAEDPVATLTGGDD